MPTLPWAFQPNCRVVHPDASSMAATRGRPRQHLAGRHPLTVAAVVVLATMLPLTACAGENPGKEVRGREPLASPEPGSIPATVEAVNTFGADLYRAYRNENRGNFVLSPYVLAYALGMNRSGAEGDTLAQLDRVLHVGPGLDLDRGFATLAQVLATRTGDRRSETRKGTIELIAASSLWAPRGTKFRDAFLDRMSGSYGVGVHVVDFRSDPETARTSMNDWARDATRGAVTQLIPRGLLTDQTSLVGASTFTLQAPWDKPFVADPAAVGRFTTIDGQSTTPRTMSTSSRSAGRYARGDGWQAIELPYLGRQLSMLLVLPDPGPFDLFEQDFTAGRLKEITAGLETAPLDLRLPRFQFETSTRLDSELNAMGATSIFNFQDADLDGVADNETLFLSATAHQSYIDVSEHGTGTQTGSISVNQEDGAVGPDTQRVTFDRPFIFLVRDQETGLVLSLGRVVNPNG